MAKRKPWVRCPVCPELMPPKALLCEKCQTIYDNGVRYQSLMDKKSLVTLGIPTAEMFGGLQMGLVGRVLEERLIQAFVPVIEALCLPSAGFAHKHDEQLFACSYVLRTVGAFKKDVPPKLRELWDAIDAAITEARKRGYEEGSSLLIGLASGETSIQDFNEATMGKQDE